MKIYKVGGAVRDSLLKKSPEDTDWVVVGANENHLLTMGFKRVGKDFPVFLHPDTKEEYALARLERKTGEGYLGFETIAHESVTLEQDLSRRDFTVNAMASDESGNLIDPYGGLNDLRNCILRHVTEAFLEDPLRILRGARFAAKLNFSIADETITIMMEMVAKDRLAELKVERVWSEFQRAMVTDRPLAFFKVLAQCRALPNLFPEFNSLFGEFFNGESHSQGTSILSLLDRRDRLERDSELIFAVISRALFLHNRQNGTLTSSQMSSFCDRLKVAKKFKTIAKRASAFKLAKKEFKTQLGRHIIHLLDAVGAFKNDHLFPKLLLLYEIELEIDRDAHTYVSAKELLSITNAVKNINKRDLIQQNLSGDSFAKKLKIKKIALANDILTPQSKSHAI
mgnify:CR=1 FL=1